LEGCAVSATVVVLVVIAGWTVASIVAALVLLPALRAAGRADAPEPRGGAQLRKASRTDAVWALRESGYLGIVLERLVLHACTICDADEVCVFGRERRAPGDGLVLVQGAGVDPDLVGRRLTVDWDPMVAALACGRPIDVPGELWPAWQGGFDRGDPVRSAAIAPVWFGGRIQGAVSVVHRGQSGERAASGPARLGELAELAGRVLSHTELRQLSAADPQPEIDALIATLARTETGGSGRTEAVAALARWVAEDIGLGGADLIELELSARLHDVARLRTPARFLRPTEEMRSSERELLRLQPLWGAELVARIPGLEAVALIVRHCRERWDGAGYPDGLAGERIPLASRIVALAAAASPGAKAGVAADRGAYDPALVARLGRTVATGSHATA
jgi:hypothetical protein